MKTRKNTYHAVVQSSYAIMGVGRSEGEAIRDAQEWGENIPACLPARPEFSGDLYVAPCTEELYRSVTANGGHIAFTERDGLIDVA